MLIFIHGFNSSGLSSKAQQLRDYFGQIQASDQLLCPDLPPSPAAAMSLLTQLIQQHAPNTVKLVGSSLGGWYATVLAERYAVRSILINPAVRPHRLLSAAVGEHINYSTGERYQFTTTHVKELVDLDLTTLQHPERIKVFVETGDELLDYHEALTFYRDTHPVVIQGGNHGFVSFITHIPEIMAF